jgi:hypothetical protein
MEQKMKLCLAISAVLGAMMLAASGAQAHCDAADGPVARAALAALDQSKVEIVYPFAPASAEAEMAAAFKMAVEARDDGPEAKAVADRYFIETAVRLHRAGEGAAYTGVKPAGQDYGLVIPAAEAALETGSVDALEEILVEEVRHAVREQFAEATAHIKEAGSAGSDDVAATREKVSAEFAFIGFAEGLSQATKGVAHAE